MYLLVVISVIYLLLLGLTIINGTYSKAGIGEKPLIYTSVIIEFILNMSMILWIGLSIFFIFYNWKVLIALFIIGIILGKIVLFPVSENLIIRPIYYLIRRMDK